MCRTSISTNRLYSCGLREVYPHRPYLTVWKGINESSLRGSRTWHFKIQERLDASSMNLQITESRLISISASWHEDLSFQRKCVPGIKKLLTNLRAGFYILMQFLEITPILGKQPTSERLRVASGLHSLLKTCPEHYVAFVCVPTAQRQPSTTCETPGRHSFPRDS